jgi:hypothetical protein
MQKVLLRVVQCSNNAQVYELGNDDDDFAVGSFSTGTWERINELITVVINEQTTANVQAYKRKHDTYIECMQDDDCNVLAVL